MSSFPKPARSTHVTNALQTNATLIDDPFARFLSLQHFLFGCSMDGPAKLHDHYRRMRGSGPTHDTVSKEVQTLRKYGVEVNILVLVSQSNVHWQR